MIKNTECLQLLFPVVKHISGWQNQCVKCINLSLDITEFLYTFDEDEEYGCVPVITLQVISDSSNPNPIIANYDNETAANHFGDALSKDTGVHFITEQMHKDLTSDLKIEGDKEENKDENKGRHALLEYLLRHDGSVICKMCGEVLQTRTHWYRHKYKHHVPQPMQPEPLFQCERCLAYFKSRKGYMSHVQSKHHELLTDSNPVLTSIVTEPFTKEQQTQVTHFKEEPDPELLIPKTSVLNYQTTNVVNHVAKSTETKKNHRNKEQNFNQAECEEKRCREEKMIIGIIERVRREYASLPSSAGPARRRGYGRRSNAVQPLRQTDARS